MSRSQRPGGLTALAFICLLMTLSYGLFMAWELYVWFRGGAREIEDFGGKSAALTFGLLDGLSALLFLLMAIGIFRSSKLLTSQLSLGLAAILTLAAALKINWGESAFGMWGLAGLTFAYMATALLWTVFRRDFRQIGVTE